MMALPPRRASSSNSAWLHFTSLTKVAPGCRFRMSRAEQHDQLIAPEDSPLAVDGADPIGVAVERDAHLGAGRTSRGR